MVLGRWGVLVRCVYVLIGSLANCWTTKLLITPRAGCNRRAELVRLVLPLGPIGVRRVLPESVVHGEVRHDGGAGVEAGDGSWSRGHAGCERIERRGLMPEDTMSQRECAGEGSAKCKAGVLEVI